MICLYHANCHDGMGAALAVWLRYGPDHQYVPVQHGGLPPEGYVGENVILVDFSYPREKLLQIARFARSILVLDHHKSAEADLRDIDAGHDGCPIEVEFDMLRSGAVMAWDRFHPEVPLPLLFRYLQDRDLWRFELEGSNEVHYGLDVEFDDWRDWALLVEPESLDAQRDLLERTVIPAGRTVMRFLRGQAERLADFPPQRFFTGDYVPMLNVPGFLVSDALHLALERWPDSPYAVAFTHTPGQIVYSLRSRSGSAMDVAELARKFGGGGHKHAAGFRVCLSNEVM